VQCTPSVQFMEEPSATEVDVLQDEHNQEPTYNMTDSESQTGLDHSAALFYLKL